MNINETMEFIEHTRYKGSKLGLSNIQNLMEVLGNPQDKLKYIHIAGTNGKGSTASMLSSILMKAGYKTGLYTSPYINRFNERIQVNGKNIPDESLIKAAEKVKTAMEKAECTPTEFEIITAIGFLYFYERKCDIVVLEVGLGGRLDSTNIIKSSEVSVITAIGIDHTNELGDTVEQIAREKAGIIKENSSVVVYQQEKNIIDEIEKICKEKSSNMLVADFNNIQELDYSLAYQSFNYGEYKNLKLGLLGDHQLSNASVVINTVEVLRTKGWNISDKDLYFGLENTKWPARFEVLKEKPTFIVDGAHNPHGVATLKRNITKYFSDKKIIFLTGVLKDKDYETIYDYIAPFAKSFIVVQPDNPRALTKEELRDFLTKKYGKPVFEGESIFGGIDKALEICEDNDVIIAFGSLYMAGVIRSYFIKN